MIKDIAALFSKSQHVVMEKEDHMSLITDRGNTEKSQIISKI